MAPVREVAFELECFEWAEERLEVAGRWKGIGTRRLNRPVLTVETESGRRKHMAALPGGQLGAPGEPWRASFAWPGDPGEITGAALEVGGNLVVDLPLPDRKRRRRRRAALGGDAGADESLRTEVTALRGQVERLRAELAGRERELIALRAQLDDAQEAEATVERAGADERTVEIERLAGELARLQQERAAGDEQRTVELQQLAQERDAALASRDAGGAQHEQDRVRWQADIDELREAFSDAAAEAEAVRDHHRAELAALQDELRAERAVVARLTARLAAVADAAPPTAPYPQPTVEAPPPAAPEGVAPGDEDAGRSADDDGEPAREGDTARHEAPGETGELEAAVLDAPGPLRAGARPLTPPGAEDQPRVSRVPAWLRGAGDQGGEGGEGPLHALKERFDGLFGTNGDGHEDADATQDAVPRPRRSAAAARARAGATVAARRRPAEVWGLRVLALVVVAALLVAFVLILVSVA